LVDFNAGQKFLRKILNHKKPGAQQYTVDLVAAIHYLDDRFLDEEDK